MRFVLHCVFFYFLMLLSVFTVRGQHHYFKHYQVDNGLVHNSITSIIQDSKGLIWIGTRGGLNRFDGYTFKAYENKKNKFGSIGNNIIISIAEDKKGMIWIGTGSGLFMYDPYQEVFTELESAPREYTSHLTIDKDNNVWFLANDNLYKYDQKRKKVQGQQTKATRLAIDRDMNLWMGNNDGIIGKYNPHKGSVANIRIIDQSVPANLRSISKIYPVNDNLILIGCFKQGLKSYNPKTGEIKSLPLRSKGNTAIYVRDIIRADDQQYWVATESGIYIYDLSTNTTQHLRKRPGDSYSLTDNAVYTFCKDNRNGMWVGTYFGGLNYYSRENARFQKYYPMQGSNSISGDAVAEILSDKKGNLWIGTEDAGINKLELKTGKFTNFTATGKIGDISYPNIHGLLAFGNQLFIGPFLHGMEIMDLRSGLVTDRFKLIGDKNEKASEHLSDFVSCIYLTKDSNLLVGTSYQGSGLFSYNRKDKTFSRIRQIPRDTYIFDITEDSKGTIWTGSVSRGAFYYNPKTGVHGNIRFGDTVKNNIINEFAVHNIFEDSNHFMWFATSGGGLIKLDPTRKTIEKFTTKEGLPSNSVFGILEDDSKHLWISSLKGLVCLDLVTERLKVYTQSNGLITDQFNYNSAFKDIDGKMYFGSVKGMIAFNPAEFDKKDVSPPTYITGFQINNKEIIPNEKNSPLTRSILYTDTIVLNHDQNNFSIEFAALNYSSPEVTRYKFRVMGLDKSWTYLNTNRNAYFTDLAAGSYTFVVQALSNTGSWAGQERRLFIKILPPFWKSFTAYCIYLFLFTVSLVWSIRSYHRYLERKNLNKLQLFEHEKEKEIYQAKIEFFTNIAHEIQTPLTLILGPVERMVKKTGEQPGIRKSLLMVEKNAKRLADLTSQLLDFRKTEMHQFGLNFVNTDISSLLKEQIASFKQEAEKRRISLNLELPEKHVIAFADREALVKICSNLISNALKYSASTATVSLISAKAKEEQFTIRFCNDGKGIPNEFSEQIFEPFFRLHNNNIPGTGIGLSLAKSLAELHNGSLTLESGNVNMVVFELTLPVHQEFEFNLSSWKKIKQV